MISNLDTMSLEFKSALERQFPNGSHGPGKFYFLNKSYIKVRDFLITIEAEDEESAKNAYAFVKDYGINHNMNWIILLKSPGIDSYFATNPEMDKIKDLLLALENVNAEFEYEKKLFYNPSFKMNLPEAEITLLSDRNIITVLHSHEDVKKFNELQQDYIREIDSLRQTAIIAIQPYDKDVYFSTFDIIKIFDYGFIFKIQRFMDGWRVSFFKKWNADEIHFVHDLSKFKDRIIELSDKHAREERFAALFR